MSFEEWENSKRKSNKQAYFFFINIMSKKHSHAMWETTGLLESCMSKHLWTLGFLNTGFSLCFWVKRTKHRSCYTKKNSYFCCFSGQHLRRKNVENHSVFLPSADNGSPKRLTGQRELQPNIVQMNTTLRKHKQMAERNTREEYY